jgi:hypothetical protein
MSGALPGCGMKVDRGHSRCSLAALLLYWTLVVIADTMDGIPVHRRGGVFGFRQGDPVDECF